MKKRRKEKKKVIFEKIKAREHDFLIQLHVGESVILQCRSVVTIQVLSGTVETLGASLTKSSGDVDAVSPPNGSVIQLIASDIEPFGNYPGFVALSITPPTMDDDVMSAISFEPVDPVRRIVEVPSWSATVDRVMAKRNVPSVTVMGAKGVGKSTFARYCVNRLLNTHSQVCYIDTDIGQPEFTAPGVVSLTVVNRPLLYTEGAYSGLLRSAETQYSYFIGAATPSANPLLYLDAIRKVAERYHRDFAHVPLVLNTMGWVAGLGIHMVNTILDITKVEVVVRLGEMPVEENDVNVFLDYMDAEECPDRQFVNIRTDEVQSEQQVRTQTIPAIELRWLRFFFHFRPDVRSVEPQGMSMASFFGRCTAQRIPRSSLKFAFQNEVEESEITVALVGVIVALAKQTQDATSPQRGDATSPRIGVDATSPRIQEHDVRDVVSIIDNAHEVISYAFVHSFTDDEVILYTPAKVTIEEGEQLLLLRGQLFWSPTKRAEENEPYWCASCITGLSTGSKVNNSRVIPRKRLRQ
eukprot:GEMP01048626.1.p1 GENE.GEMP01048626.1~~GEMP01048626.1.p1  ORF type:complete len:531 (+),score=109.83 GEMP01048626.1:23-1594(+)